MRARCSLFRRVAMATCTGVWRPCLVFGHCVTARARQGLQKMPSGFPTGLPTVAMDKSGGARNAEAARGRPRGLRCRRG